MSTTILERPVDCPVAPESPEGKRQTCSELIRRGAQYHPHGRGMLYNVYDGSTCALGALVTGLLGPSYFARVPRSDFGVCGINGVPLDTLVQERTGVSLSTTIVPLPWGGDAVLQTAIIYLNDHTPWSREDIADWLASLGL